MDLIPLLIIGLICYFCFAKEEEDRPYTGHLTPVYEEIKPLPTSIAISVDTPSCPKCHGNTRLKLGKYGYFIGCSKFPKCKGTISVF